MLAGLAIVGAAAGCGPSSEPAAKRAPTPVVLDVGAIFRASLAAFRRDIGRYPTTEEGLIVLLYPPKSAVQLWRGPYLEGSEVPLDPWNHRYLYRFPTTRESPDEYDVWSLGPDGVPSDDDIGNWTK